MANVPEGKASATRRLIAQVMRRVLALAVYPARHRTDLPIPRGWLPKAKDDKAKDCLYPEDDRKLLRCTGVPLVRRLMYGVLSREGLRTDECASLRWKDLNLGVGRIRLDVNKTNRPRAWALNPGVLAALRIWAEHHRPNAKKDDHVFSTSGVAMNVDHLAEQLRQDLEAAGVKEDRPELFEHTAVRRQIRAHDLRATFCTLSLASGRSETWVQDRTGWTTSGMLNKYRRSARQWAELDLGGLDPLERAIPEFAAIAPSTPHEGDEATHETGAKSSLVHGRGLEPLRSYPAEPKSAASANFATRASDLWGCSRRSRCGGRPATVRAVGALYVKHLRRSRRGRFGDQLWW